MDILHRSGRTIEYSVSTDFVVQMDPIDWVDKFFLYYNTSVQLLSVQINSWKNMNLYSCRDNQMANL